MLKVKYPLSGSKDFLEIFIGQPQCDEESPDDDYRCECKLSAPNYERKFQVYGIDELQSMWLALRQLKVEISNFEKIENKTLKYCFFQGSE